MREGWLGKVGESVSRNVADAAANPVTQLGVLTFCAVWWIAGLPTDILTATLSILAITLTQMVLNRQRLREDDDRRRDVAMHAKLDELLRAEQFARKELAGIEKLEASELSALQVRLDAESTKAMSKPGPRRSPERGARRRS